MLETEKLAEFLVTHGHLPIDQLLEEVYGFCSEYAGQRGFEDDVTMIGLEVF
ncbi:MAG: hypothetical protein HQ517_11085 [SAR324 cluster bacterium]|nr:hypothetical protein [SAR324 cluster bacterium]